jgi:hypothetical protein
MSVESLKARIGKDIAWVDEKSMLPGEFGPPLYDENALSYKWRVFKRGFNWGNYFLFFINCI